MMNTEEDKDRDSHLYFIAGAIADQAEIDWRAAETSASEEQRPLVHFLKVISGIPQAHYLERESLTGSVAGTPVSWGPLQIIQKVGQGVFGEVFRARDSQLDREVALKLFYPDRYGHSRPAEELIAEGRLLARVRHPNVAVVHGAEEHDDRVGIWMEFIEGSTLEEYVGEKGSLDPEEAMVIGRDVCRALKAVHRAEVIHRDIKASNVMRERDGRIVVLDLGASRDTSRHDSARIYGTPFYAAPEVLLENRTSRASDIYCVGVLIYFMLTGQYPVKGRSVDDIREAHERGLVQRLRDLRPDLPAALLSIVDKALAPEPANRFRSAGEFEQALIEAMEKAQRAPWILRYSRWLLPLVTAIALTLAFTLGPLRDWLGSRADRPSLAVLFFDNLGPPGEDDFIAAGLTEDIITSLSQLGDLDVLSRNAVQRYRDQEADPQEVGRTLGTAYVLEGSLRRVEDNLRVTAQLIDARNGFHVWADRFDGTFEEIFSIQDTIASHIGRALGVTATDEEYALVTRRWTRNAQAYAYFLMGREKHITTYIYPKQVPEVRRLYEKALELDPDYAPALAGLARLLLGREWLLSGSEPSLEPGNVQKALDLAHAAQRLDPSLGMAWHAEGRALIRLGEVSRARAAYEHALELNPRLSECYSSLYFIYERNLGLRDKAIENARRGIAADPYYPVCYFHLAWLLSWRFGTPSDEFAEADSVIAEGLARMPDDPMMRHLAAWVTLAHKRYADAIAAFEDIIADHPDVYRAYYRLRRAYLSTGQLAAADSICQLTINRWPDIPVVIDDAGWHSYGQKRYDEAECLFRKAISLDEFHFEARRHLGLCLYQLGRVDEAEAIMLDVVARWSDIPEPYDWICNFYYNLASDWAETEKWAQEAMRRFPERAVFRSWLAWAYWNQDRWEEAAELFKQAIAIQGNNFLDYRGLSSVLFQLDRPDEAVDVVESWVDRQPRHAFGRHFLGWAYMVAGEHYQAAAAIEKALELKPSKFVEKRALTNLAVIYEREGRHEKALETFRRVAAIDSSDADPWRRMAWLAWFDMRDRALASEAARTAIRLDSDEDEGSLPRADGHFILGDIAREEGELAAAADHYEQARVEAEALIKRYPRNAAAISTAGLIYTRIGEMDEARKCAAWLLENQKKHGSPLYMNYIAACIYSMIGDLEQGFEALEAAITGGYRDKVELLNDPDLDNLRSDRRFQELYDSIK